MTSASEDPHAAQNPRDDEKDLIDEKFHALVSGLSLDQSSPTSYLDELDKNDDDHFTPPSPEKIKIKKFIIDGFASFRKWKDNSRPDDSGLDDDGAQV